MPCFGSVGGGEAELLSMLRLGSLLSVPGTGMVALPGPLAFSRTLPSCGDEGSATWASAAVDKAISMALTVVASRMVSAPFHLGCGMTAVGGAEGEGATPEPTR